MLIDRLEGVDASVRMADKPRDRVGLMMAEKGMRGILDHLTEAPLGTVLLGTTRPR
jgi:hypothetical protein